jgi:hypothetical protein
MLRAHKICLAPNNEQATYLARAAGTARFAYNWALAEWKRQYEAWKIDDSLPKPSQGALRRQLNAIKRAQFPWMLDVTKNAPQTAIIQLGEAFRNFFAGRDRFTSLAELEHAISQYIEHHYSNPKPFIWTASTSDIPAKVTRAKDRLGPGPSISARQIGALH